MMKLTAAFRNFSGTNTPVLVLQGINLVFFINLANISLCVGFVVSASSKSSSSASI
jgi:hypothetical protein